MLRIPVAGERNVTASAVAIALALVLWPAQPAAADPASIGGPVSTAAGAATDTETGVKQALAAAEASPRVPAASPSKPRSSGVAKTVYRATDAVTSPVTRTRERGTDAPASPAIDIVRATADQLAPVADVARRTTERVGRPTHVVPPAVPALLPPAAGQAVPPVTRGPARPVIPLRPGITRPPLPPAAIAAPAADEPAQRGGAAAIFTSQHGTVAAIQADPRVPIVPPAGSGARRAGTVLPALPAPDAVRGGEAWLDALAPFVAPSAIVPAVVGAPALVSPTGHLASPVAGHGFPPAPAAARSPAGAGAGGARTAGASAVWLLAVLCLSGALAASVLWRLLPAPAARRPADFSCSSSALASPRG